MFAVLLVAVVLMVLGVLPSVQGGHDTATSKPEGCEAHIACRMLGLVGRCCEPKTRLTCCDGAVHPGQGVKPWVNHYDGDNPLNIIPLPQREDNFFVVIGDWGKFGGPGQCQNEVAELLKRYVANQTALGRKCLFIAAVGDNFYWTGVGDDTWQVQWESVYGTNDVASPLYGIPWLAVMGNHDYGNSDPYAGCPWVSPTATINGQAYASRQFNADKNPSRPGSTQLYWLPDYNYHYEIPQVGLELIAVDENSLDLGGLGGDAGGHDEMFELCGGAGTVQSFLNSVTASGEKLLQERAQFGSASTVVLIQHYPQAAQRIKSLYQAALGPRTVHTLAAYGHTHAQQCDGRNTKGQCDLILTGGGGGCCASDLPGAFAGFTAVHLTADGGFISDVDSDLVHLEHRGQCSWASQSERVLFM